MRVVPEFDRKWVTWIKEEVAQRRLPCMAGCGDPAVKIKFQGKRSGAFCGGCYSEIFRGTIPKLDMPPRLRKGQRRR